MDIRHYSPLDDYDMIVDWWAGHGRSGLPDHLLSPIGIIAGVDGEDQAAIFIYCDRHTPVCFAEQLVTAPGLPVGKAIRASQAAIQGAIEYGTKLGYRIMKISTPKGVARYAQREGFQVSGTNLVGMACEMGGDNGH